MTQVKKLIGIALILSGALDTLPAHACSVFTRDIADKSDNSAQWAIGKNFDWQDSGGFFAVNERDRKRTSLSGTYDWVSNYGSMSLSTIGPGFPVSGMNEAGLVVEALVDYSGVVDAGQGVLASLEWAQYQLDKHNSVQQVIDYTTKNGLAQMALPLHFFVCDINRKCAVFESTTTGVKIVKPENMGPQILANNPYLNDRSEALKLSKNPFARLFTSKNDSSMRYLTLMAHAKSKKKVSKNEVFSALDEAAIKQINVWQLVWIPESKNLTYKVRLDDGNNIKKTIDMSALDFECGSQVKVIDLNAKKFKLRIYSENDANLAKKRLSKVLAGTNKGLAEAVSNHTLNSSCQ